MVAGKKKEGQDKLLDLVRGGGVVVKVVSESWHCRGSLQEKKVLGKHSVILHSLLTSPINSVLNFHLMTLGLVELWELKGSRPDINMNTSSEPNSTEGEDESHKKLQKSLAGVLQCFLSERREE